MKDKDEHGISTDCSTQWITDVLGMGAHARLTTTIKPPKGYMEGCRDADFFVKFCPECRKTWELQDLNYQDKKILHSYTHIPSYGKAKEVCIDCK